MMRRFIGLFLTIFFLTSCGGDVDPRGDLDADSQLALEVGIVSNLDSPYALHPATISDELRERLEALGSIQMRNTVYGSIMPAPEGKSGAIIKANSGGAVLETSISGIANASITVRDGEVGLVDGNIYIGQGTQLIDKDGQIFTFVRGKWSAKKMKPLEVGPDTILILTVTFSQVKEENYGLTSHESTRANILANRIFNTYKALPQGEKDPDALIQELETMKVKTIDTQQLYLADIATIEYRLARRLDEDDDDTMMVGYKHSD